MEVKGTALQSLQKFVRTKFGEPGHEKWLDALSPEARALYRDSILSSSWFPITPMLALPTQNVCDLFYGGDLKGAYESGIFAADDGLRGLYRMFVVAGSPTFIIKKAATVLSTFYRPSTIERVEEKPKAVTFHMTHFPEPHPAVEFRIAGWMEQGLVVCGCKGIQVKIGKSLTKGDPYTEYFVTWQ